VGGINDSGQIVGSFRDTTFNGFSHGFLYDGGVFTTIDVPSERNTQASAINNGGEIVGSFNPSGFAGGYLYAGGSFTTTQLGRGAQGINNNGTEIVGWSGGTIGPFDEGAYLATLSSGVITSYMLLNAPGSASFGYGVNNTGTIVGAYFKLDHTQHIFVGTPGAFSDLALPPAFVLPSGDGSNGGLSVAINDAGQIVGSYDDAAGNQHGFVDTNGSFTTIDFPGGVMTTLTGINNAGDIVGNFRPAPLQFVPLRPCRVADTRNPNGPFGGPELAANAVRAFAVRNSSCGIPAGALAYSVNLTVVPDASLGYLTVWPYGLSQPFVSTLNSDGRIKANAAIVPAGTDTGGSVNVYVTDPTQFIMDIDGYFVPAGSSTSGLQFFTMAPCRVADTRNAAGPLGGPFIVGGASRSFPVNTTCGIPATAAAYSLNFTAVPHGSLEYITAWPEGAAFPLASVLNAPTGTVVANAALIPAGSPNGGVSVYASDDTDVILDIDGYFAPPSIGGLSFYTLPPCRVLDTRPNAFSGSMVVDVPDSSCASPNAEPQAYVLNATVIPSEPLSYLTLWADGASQPFVSTLNAFDAAITSNMAIVPTVNSYPTFNGKIDVYATNPTNLILDISGYFAP
jgi:uncharacterized membrane protein